MDDLISRQAAIDAVHEWLCDVFGTYDKNIDILKRLRGLPSAVDVVPCKECEDVNKCHNYVVKKSASNGCIFCPLTFCSEGRRKG